jgi:hypothetical protein
MIWGTILGVAMVLKVKDTQAVSWSHTVLRLYTINTMLYDHRIVRSHKGLPNVLYPKKQREHINTSKTALEHISL